MIMISVDYAPMDTAVPIVKPIIAEFMEQSLATHLLLVHAIKDGKMMV